MTIWTPEIPAETGSIYKAIADSLAADIRAGKLKPGSRLPTQRDLADRLGLTVTTVTRAYAEAARRGLIAAHVGRGTFVREFEPEEESGTESRSMDLTVNSLLPEEQAAELKEKIAAFLSRTPNTRFLNYNLRGGSGKHRAAGAAWIERFGLKAEPSRLLVTAGAQHAMAVAIGTLVGPGGLVLTEEFTYTGMKSLANHLKFRLQGVPMDEEGIIPGALIEVCRYAKPTALYCMPTIQNPSTATMSEDRRRAIAAIARDHDIAIIEDDTYGFLQGGIPRLSSFAPERSYYIVSTSKSLVPAMRIGFLMAPEGMVERLSAAIFATTVMASTLTAEIVSEWIADGTADRLLDWKRRETAARLEIARRSLAGLEFQATTGSSHLWLRLPEPWRADDFVLQAKMRGILLTPAEDFVVGLASAPHCVRICLGPPQNRKILQDALNALAEILGQRPAPHRSVV